MKKFIAAVMVFVLLFAMPVSVFANDEASGGESEQPDTPAPLEFAAQIRVGLDLENPLNFIPAVMDILSCDDGFGIDISGTFLREGWAFSSHAEISADLAPFVPWLGVPQFLIRLLGINLAEPFRLSVDADFSVLDAPTCVIMLELPRIARMALAFLAPEFSRPYFVFDLSEILAEAVEEFEIEIIRISDAYRQEILEVAQDTAHEISALLQYYTGLWFSFYLLPTLPNPDMRCVTSGLPS